MGNKNQKLLQDHEKQVDEKYKCKYKNCVNKKTLYTDFCVEHLCKHMHCKNNIDCPLHKKSS